MISGLSDIIKREQKALENSKNPNEKVNILFNLIVIKNNNNCLLDYDNHVYKDIKLLINNYVELIKINDFGYDSLCTPKILRIISYLSFSEQESILYYLFSVLTREFPELDKDWVLNAIKKVKIKKVFKQRMYSKIPSAILLYSSLSISKLLIALLTFIAIVTIILLPAPLPEMALFEVNYINLSDSFFLNHVLNVISIFGEIENGCQINATSALGLLIQLFGKALFILLIVNFIYKKISDKISIR